MTWHRLASAISDEVEARVTILKVLVDHRRCLVLATALADQGSETMRIPDAGRLLDRARNVVVSVTQLVSQVLNFVRRLSDRVVENGESCRSRHTLLGGYTYEIELISIPVSHCLVDDSTCQWILKLADITSKDSGVYSLAAVHVHQLARR